MESAARAERLEKREPLRRKQRSDPATYFYSLQPHHPLPKPRPLHQGHGRLIRYVPNLIYFSKLINIHVTVHLIIAYFTILIIDSSEIKITHYKMDGIIQQGPTP